MTDPQVYMYVSNLQNQSDFRGLFSKRINRSPARDYNYTFFILHYYFEMKFHLYLFFNTRIIWIREKKTSKRSENNIQETSTETK